MRSPAAFELLFVHDATIDLPGIELPGKQSYSDIFGLWVREQGLSFGDCAHMVCARRWGLPAFISFDKATGRLPGLTRLEPDDV